MAEALTELELLHNALTACGFSKVTEWNETLRRICEKLHFSVSPTQSLSLTLDDFDAWSITIESKIQMLHGLVAETLSVLISQASSESSLQ